MLLSVVKQAARLPNRLLVLVISLTRLTQCWVPTGASLADAVQGFLHDDAPVAASQRVRGRSNAGGRRFTQYACLAVGAY